ncbi:MAG: hypothetical protein P4L22_01460 [Candidatus Babeliales bacterium]|nr:hypothetical protein [Candidatus Babeliales bacterium]
MKNVFKKMKMLSRLMTLLAIFLCINIKGNDGSWLVAAKNYYHQVKANYNYHDKSLDIANEHYNKKEYTQAFNTYKGIEGALSSKLKSGNHFENSEIDELITVQFYIADMLYRGMGVKKNYKEAVLYFKKSIHTYNISAYADNAFLAASYLSLGDIYYYGGFGIETNYETADYYYQGLFEHPHAFFENKDEKYAELKIANINKILSYQDIINNDKSTSKDKIIAQLNLADFYYKNHEMQKAMKLYESIEHNNDATSEQKQHAKTELKYIFEEAIG